MRNMLFRINASGHPKLKDEEMIKRFMDSLMDKHPGIHSYQYERSEDDYLNILVWGEHE